ncbi:MAG: precorrin-8X methylmutase [Cuspidothrix sp.]
MRWHVTDAQSLAIIDTEIGDHLFSPAEYEVVRRVVYATSDFEYKSLIRFSEHSLESGASALAARSTIVVDEPVVQAGIAYDIQNKFANPLYCGMEGITRPQKEKPSAVSGIETLARRYPEGIFVVGQSQMALTALVQLIEAEEIRPALIVATPPEFVNLGIAKQRLRESLVPHITIEGRKGNALVSSAIIDALVDLAWQAYGQDGSGGG